MKTEYDFTPEDVLAFMVGHNKHSPEVRRQVRRSLIYGALLVSVMPVLVLLTTDEPRLEVAIAIWPLLLGPALFIMFFPRMLRWRMVANLKRALADDQNSQNYGLCSIAIEDNGLRETNTTGETLRTWSSVEKVLVTDEHAFIYTGSLEVTILPRRAFASDGDFMAFVGEICQRGNVVSENI